MVHQHLEFSSETGMPHSEVGDLERGNVLGEEILLAGTPIPCKFQSAAGHGLLVSAIVTVVCQSETHSQDGWKFGFSRNPSACLRRQWVQTAERRDLGG